MFKYSKRRTDNTCTWYNLSLHFLPLAENVIFRKQSCCKRNICFSIYIKQLRKKHDKIHWMLFLK